MSLLNYDKALYEKIKSVYTEVVFAAPEESFKINAQNHEGRVCLPYISVWRLPEFTITRNTYNDTRVRKGADHRITPLQARRVRGVPVTLTYQLDVYSDKRSTCDGIASELMLHLLEFPYVNVNIDGIENTQYQQQFEIVLSDSVVDNTSIGEFSESGRIYRLTIEAIFYEAIIYRIDKYDSNLVEKVLVDLSVVLNNEITTESFEDVGVLE